LLNQLGAKSHELLIRDRPRFPKAIELLDFVGDTEADHTAQLIACMLCLLAAPFSHAPSLSDHVCEYTKVGKRKQRDYPDRLGPPGDIVASKEIAKDRDEQPEPDNEDEYCEDVY